MFGLVGSYFRSFLSAAFPDSALIEAGFDVTDAATVRSAVAEARPDAAVHLAAIAAPSQARQDPDQAWRVNLGGTLNVARAILLEAPACLLLFASSGDAYGASFRAGRPLDESAALAPLNAYGATKAAADLALGAMEAEGLRCVRVRAFNHTGPGQSGDFVVPAFARQVARITAGQQEKVIRVGALEPMRDFLDVRDVCELYASVLGRDDLPPGTILNAASGRTRRIGDILQAMMAMAGVEARVCTDAGRLRPSDIAVAAGDARTARRLLGWEPRIPWERTLGEVLADWQERLRENPDAE